MKKPNALANALRNSGATVAAAPAPAVEIAAEAVSSSAATARHGTKPITVHFPPEVRRQIKSMAAGQGRTMDDAIAEAFNLLFVRYGLPELAPRKIAK